MTSAEIRDRFFEFFRSKQHAIVASAPIVVKDDPTLMFTNAGMNQFKDYFLGNKKPPHARIADTQKCLRVSGKHNDLEEVGVDTYHHTMFEMLGNWSFGDYFKKEAIEWSWELLTSVYQIPKDRLYVTVFEGDAAESLPRDEEAANEWKKWIAADRIINGNKKDNFWEMGDTGPCGPCTEIHVDTRTDDERKKIEGRDLVNKDHPQVIEIWNNVFIQFNRLKDGSLEQLPAKHVDTGMGFERLVRVLQGKQSNYDTDVFTGTIIRIEELTGKEYGGTDKKSDIAFRVLADHIRAVAFAIADGQMPSNTGAGYVIRRILRRAVRYYYSYLDFKQPLLFNLVAVLSEQFKKTFPELHLQNDFVVKVIREEEEGFLRTLDKGLKRIDEMIKTGNGNISGKDAFELYDTYGFPADLTSLIAAENKFTVDQEGFTAEMKKQKDRSRAASVVDTEDWVMLDNFSLSSFLGYDSLELKTRVIRYRKATAKGKSGYQIVLEATPFYAESGGQVGDTGILDFGGEVIEVYDTKKENDLILHFTNSLPQDIQMPVQARVNKERRNEITVHHSATHLLHAALRIILGTHVAQKGSLVYDEQLRFDFSHFSKMSADEIKKVESLVNAKIRDNIPVVIKEMPKNDAVAMGAMALFGEKYSDIVRVVIIDPRYSIELCGGTHVGSTGELGYFKILSESAIAAGVRRIEAVSGLQVEKYLNEQLGLIDELSDTLKGSRDIVKSVQTLQQENAALKKRIEKLESLQLSGMRDKLSASAEKINGTHFIGSIVEVGSPDALKKLAGDLRNSVENGVVVLGAAIEGKAHVVNESLGGKPDAGKLIKEIAPLIKGGGGGQKSLATAGGSDTSRLQEVVSAVRSSL